MAAAVAVTPSAPEVGSPITFAATGFANTTAITLAVTGPDGDFAAHDVDTTDGAGAYTWTGEVTAEAPGIMSWSITDGTTTKKGTVEVFSE